MAQSSCPKCDNHSFELVEAIPINSNYKLMYIQCTSCGAVVGVMDYYNIGAKLGKIENVLKIK